MGSPPLTIATTVEWQEPLILAKGKTIEGSGATGVYVLFTPKKWWPATMPGSDEPQNHGNDIIFVGSGDLAKSLTTHATGQGNLLVRTLMRKKVVIALRWAFLLPEAAACFEAQLLSDYQERYGHLPAGNTIRPTPHEDSGFYSFQVSEDVIGEHHISQPPVIGMKLSQKMAEALRRLNSGSLVVYPGRYFAGYHGEIATVHPTTAKALQSLGLVEIRFVGGRGDRDRGLNKNYAYITDAGKAHLAASQVVQQEP